MKRFLWLAIAGLLLLNLYIGWCHWRYESTPPDEELERTPKAPGELTVAALPVRIAPDLERMNNSNLFDPERGKGKPAEAVSAATPERPAFELVGICALGESSGAIIDRKNEVASDPKKMRCYYSLGSEVGNGFILDMVLENMVILRRDGEVMELKVGRSRFSEQAKGSATLERMGSTAARPGIPVVPAGASEPGLPAQENNGGTR